ncbi:MAG: glycerophosphodiester phosphodiesterase [Promethearchaeota archaeon]|nr:MAG: glycerophosphodiester phosphodiesterase [Candidatus Lokiarchaeota archaeon]
MVNVINNNRKRKDVLVIAHRGASSIAPPNTMKSFQKAIELDADYIEFDVHRSKDGEIVIIHDAYISQESGQTRLIKDMTLQELKNIDVGNGEQIPTLKELIKIAKGNIGLHCEVKALNFSKELVQLLIQENLRESTIISSFLFNELLKIQKLDTSLKLGLIIPKEIRSLQALIKYSQKAIDNNFYAVHPYFKSINKEYIEFTHKHNLKVNVWTVNMESDMKEVLKLGIDGIISDDIDLVKKLLNA